MIGAPLGATYEWRLRIMDLTKATKAELEAQLSELNARYEGYKA